MNTVRIQISEILQKCNFDETSANLVEKRIEEAIAHSNQNLKEKAMDKFLTQKEFQEKENAIVKAIYELKTELNKQTITIVSLTVGILGGLIGLVTFLVKVIH